MKYHVRMKWVHTLIDYDNAKEGVERGQSDVAINLSMLIPSIARKVSFLIPNSEELHCRLYGGWIMLDGQTTHQGGWLLSEAPKMRAWQGSLRVKVTIATALVCRSDLVFSGTYRDGGQKMVDSMITTDLFSLSSDKDQSIILVSDDEDFVPGIVASAESRNPKNPIYVLRRRKKPGSSPNDFLFNGCHVVIAEY